jgi:hypothetical protein
MLVNPRGYARANLSYEAKRRWTLFLVFVANFLGGTEFGELYSSTHNSDNSRTMDMQMVLFSSSTHFGTILSPVSAVYLFLAEQFVFG